MGISVLIYELNMGQESLIPFRGDYHAGKGIHGFFNYFAFLETCMFV